MRLSRVWRRSRLIVPVEWCCVILTAGPASAVAEGCWYGDICAAGNYQICCGLAAYGDPALAAAIADKTVENAIRNGISERYDSISGRAEGVPHLGMTCTVLTLMLEGLCRKYRLEIRKA